jgi:acetylglutamate kinase
VTGVVVVKISGKPIDTPEACAALWSALASAAERTRLVLVHGGGAAVDRRLAAMNLPTVRRAGLRVTPEDQIGVVAGVLAGEVNGRLVGVLRAAGVDAVGIALSSGGLCACEVLRPTDEAGAPVDLGRVGRVVGGDGRVVEALHGEGFVPVVSSIGLDARGGLLNVNADDAAAGVARATGAVRLVLLTDVAGVLDASGAVVAELDAERAAELTAAGVIVGGMIPKARAALDAAEAVGAAGAEVAIGSWADAAALIAGTPGVGTRVARRRAGSVA